MDLAALFLWISYRKRKLRKRKLKRVQNLSARVSQDMRKDRLFSIILVPAVDLVNEGMDLSFLLEFLPRLYDFFLTPVFVFCFRFDERILVNVFDLWKLVLRNLNTHLQTKCYGSSLNRVYLCAGTCFL